MGSSSSGFLARVMAASQFPGPTAASVQAIAAGDHATAGRRPLASGRLAGIAVAVACLTPLATAPASAAETVTDGRGRTVEIADTSRIVSVGGTVTEILYALGHGDNIVAVDSTSLYPPEALKTKDDVGYLRSLAPEGVLAEAPTLIVAEGDVGPPPAVDVLTSSTVPMVIIDNARTPEAVESRIRFIAGVIGEKDKGEALARHVQEGFDRLAAARAKVGKPVRVIFVLSLRNGQPMVAGSGTAADAAIRLAGAENVAASVEGYKGMTEEAIVEAAPDAVVMMAHAQASASADEVFAMPAFRMVPAAEGKRLIKVDGLALLGFGPRTPEAALELCHALDPACTADAP